MKDNLAAESLPCIVEANYQEALKYQTDLAASRHSLTALVMEVVYEASGFSPEVFSERFETAHAALDKRLR